MGRPSIESAIVRAGLVSAVAVAASLAMGTILLPLLGAAFDTAALVMSLVCPLLIAFPISLLTYRQREALERAHRALVDAHAALALAHSRLAEKARMDHLTGMLNRGSFFDAVRDARAGGQAGALLIIDADHFKRINDEHGHQVGDIALLRIAAAIRAGARRRDILGRIGGEEFAAFLPETDEAEAQRVAEQIRCEVEKLRVPLPRGGVLGLSVSIGGKAAPPEAAIAELMRCADRRLYAAKHRGRNRVVFADEPAVAAA